MACFQLLFCASYQVACFHPGISFCFRWAEGVFFERLVYTLVRGVKKTA